MSKSVVVGSLKTDRERMAQLAHGRVSGIRLAFVGGRRAVGASIRKEVLHDVKKSTQDAAGVVSDHSRATLERRGKSRESKNTSS